MTDATIFEDVFNITSANSEKYDRVTRLLGTSTDNTISLTFDVNHELYPVTQGETLNIVLATTLKLDGSKEDEKVGFRELGNGEASLADMYDYVCYGRVYRVTEDNEEVKVYISFGGLLLVLQGPYKKLTGLKMQHLYVLVKK